MSSRHNTKRRDTSTPELYSSGSFNGLKFFDTKDDDIDLDKSTLFVPDIKLIENNSKAIFDFTDYEDSTYFDQTHIILESLVNGDVITLKNALHIDPITEKENNLNGTYEVSNIYDKTIVTDVLSVSDPESYDKKYSKDGFINKYNLTANLSSIPTDSRFLVKNYLSTTKNQSFGKLGVLVGDYIRFNNGLNSGILYEILSLDFDENDNELLVLSGSTFSEENRFEAQTNFSLYRTDVEVSIEEEFLYADDLSEFTYIFKPMYSNQNKYNFNYNSFSSPTLVLFTGINYIFDNNYNSNRFCISETKDGIWNGGVDYPKNQYFNNLLLLKFEAPDTLYYYDKKFRNSGGKIIILSGIDGETPINIQSSDVSARLKNLPSADSSVNTFMSALTSQYYKFDNLSSKY